MSVDKKHIAIGIVAVAALTGGTVAAYSQSSSPTAAGSDVSAPEVTASATTPTEKPVPAPEVTVPSEPVDPRAVKLRVSNASDYDKATPTLKVEPAAPGLSWHDATGTVVGLAAPATTYKVTMNYAGEALKPFTFTTADAPRQKAYWNVKDGGKYGIGMPIRVEFKRAVLDRAAVERASSVTSSPAQSGSWGWLSDRLMVWRPDRYWEQGTQVKVNLAHGGVLLDKEHFGTDRRAEFTIGRSMIMRIQNSTKKMEVIREGSVVKTVPVSMGKATAKHRTRSGVKVISTRQRNYTMTGPPSDPYSIKVDYAMRLTFSGEFVHSAPWSVHAQGYRNVSHGCTNVSPSNAAWLYKNTLVGDVVETQGTGRKVTSLQNGWGALWNVSPEKWRTYSVLSPDSRYNKKAKAKKTTKA